VLSEDLRAACLGALEISPQACLEFAAKHTWEASARAFVENMTNINELGPKDDVEFAVKPSQLVA
jgi:hypothetical protein